MFAELLEIDFVLDDEDIAALNVSEGNHRFKAGQEWKVNSHQFRRSFAYYLVGYQLCSFPALKQQLGHLSLAMTMHYAKNAIKFSRIWHDVEREKVEQSAKILARLYGKMANDEPVAGGKAKSWNKELFMDGKNHFKVGDSNKLLSTDYWREMLVSGKEHIHAIAPSMYCSNASCSMRINIDLTECVGCEFDYIEDAQYAHTAIMTAKRNLDLLVRNNELNPSSATKEVMTVKAAEKILSDLGLDFEPVDFPEDILNKVINFEVAS
ncbi:site-specific integrase [Paraferrimonas haliotis]|uniref:Phage integrase family protein n=1 Tax=Paraferrimonas haliotis TaxID=2013866 RepID=A0AA37TSS4_9GAMM|nr:site-specific integrase [Paraferrimonas haliotis]GLS83746.1 hypothetical protein GCM10007894_17230 [Paraferrimonas haliotis]